MDPITNVPVSLVCGALGVGKTTAILDLMSHRPEGERWAILVNEFGEIGIDGVLLDRQGDFEVREIPGGCVCCSSGPQLQIHLVQLLRSVRPDRLIIEPTGLALPGAIVDMLRRPGMAEAVDVKAVITLVDPRRIEDSRLTELESWHAQIEAADILVGTRADLCTDAELDDFRRWAEGLFPPKTRIATVPHGRLDPAWLDLDPTPRAAAHEHHHDHAEHVVSMGWVHPRETVWDRRRLVEALQSIAQGHPGLPATVLRMKGVFRTNRGWISVQGTDVELNFQPIQYRTQSRFEILVEDEPPSDAAAVEASLEAALWTR